MTRELALADLLRCQEGVHQAMLALAAETDPRRRVALVARVEEEARALAQLSADFERQELAKAGPPPRGSLEVVLTPSQRERVRRETELELTTVTLRDETGVLTRAMPHLSPDGIDRMVIAEAHRQRSTAASERDLRAEVERLLTELEAKATGEGRQAVARLRADPSFLDGLLHRR